MDRKRDSELFCVVSAVPQKSLGHEVNDLASSQLLKLEKENQMLLKSVEELKVSGEKDNQKLSHQVRVQTLLNTLAHTRTLAHSLTLTHTRSLAHTHTCTHTH